MRYTSLEIEARLAVLVGLPFWRTTRAADLQGFQFGTKVLRTDRSGQTVEVGEYILHVQCAFRFRVGHNLVVASRDRYEVIDGGDTWDRRGANLLDVRMEQLVAGHCPINVTAVRATLTGDVTIELGPELILEVWVDDSSSDEHWRFFKRGDESPHVVFASGRAQEE
jgi:hypothetical protein